MPHNTPAPLTALYFDGRSARGHAVTLQVLNGQLQITGPHIHHSLPTTDVQWPERTRHGKRLAHLKDGGSLQCADTTAWDAWYTHAGLREPLAVTLQQSWRWVMGSVLVLVVMAVAVNAWGLPWLARGIVALTPPSVDVALGERTLSAMDQALMSPSELPAARQAQLRNAMAQTLAPMPPAAAPVYTLVFRKSRIGPNALALPGGTLIMTDEMVTLVEGDEKVLSAVLAHELGHLQHRHGLRMLVQAAALGALGAVVLGDFSTVLAAVPALLGQAHYSRQAEHEADVYAVRLLKAAGISPSVMLTLFDKMAQQRKAKAPSGTPSNEGDNWIGIAFASHPSDAERIAFFRAAAQ